MKVCTICNRVYPAHAKVCEHDGQRLVSVRRDDTTGDAPAIDWDGPLAGDVVGNYRLASMIAEGGMGRIFKATHVALDRPAAIKFLLPEHAARADLVQRFFNEARTVNAIHHPHIVDIFDFVQDQGGGGALVYMVMEYLVGEDARARLQRRGTFAPAEVIHVGAQTADALDAAHRAGILHRDLKPDNIFLCEAPEPDFVKLLDFGAAKAFGDRPGHHLTRPGVAIGTPEYMAPEQIKASPLDGRVDAYALGIVCYELLAGVVPFKSEKVGQLLAMHTRQPPRPLSEVGAASASVPPDLEAVVMRLLAKSPDDRFPDLAAVAAAFRACGERPPEVATQRVEDEPTAAAAEPQQPRARPDDEAESDSLLDIMIAGGQQRDEHDPTNDRLPPPSDEVPPRPAPRRAASVALLLALLAAAALLLVVFTRGS